MKAKSLLAGIAAILLSVTLSACGTYAGYDDDTKTVKGGSWSAVSEASSSTTNHFVMSCGKCNGVKTIGTVSVLDNSSLDMTLNIDSGRFKLVLVKSNSVYLVTDGNSQGPVPLTNVPSGNYTLKMVAEDAKFQLDVRL